MFLYIVFSFPFLLDKHLYTGWNDRQHCKESQFIYLFIFFLRFLDNNQWITFMEVHISIFKLISLVDRFPNLFCINNSLQLSTMTWKFKTNSYPSRIFLLISMQVYTNISQLYSIFFTWVYKSMVYQNNIVMWGCEFRNIFLYMIYMWRQESMW